LPATDSASHVAEVTRWAISQHLGVLPEAHLVTERRDGARLFRADH
jgi:DNA-binding transcriptional ArsR family regulator